MSDIVPDEQLMERYVKGDVRAFQTLVDRYSGPIFNFIVRRCGGNRERAEDLLQETFLRVIRRSETFRSESKFTTWLYTIARNLCVDALRRAGYRNHASLDKPLSRGESSGATLLDTFADKGPDPGAQTQDQRFRSALQAALDTLPEDQRDVFVMREFQGLKFREIGDIIDIPENTVKSRMRYALQGLRKELAEFYDPA